MPEIDIGTVLTHIWVVLVAAKVAAEISERIGIPAVVGEIIAGILIGPSVLDVVGSDEVLRVLGELGVILLLLDVGLEMDIVELGRVGRTSLSVAVVVSNPAGVTSTTSPPLPTGFPCASRAVTTAFTVKVKRSKGVQVTTAVLALGLTGPGATMLLNGLPDTGVPLTRTST